MKKLGQSSTQILMVKIWQPCPDKQCFLPPLSSLQEGRLNFLLVKFLTERKSQNKQFHHCEAKNFLDKVKKL